MRGVEATTRQLLIAARQVCSTVQGIHLSETKHIHKLKCKKQTSEQILNQILFFFTVQPHAEQGRITSTNLYCTHQNQRVVLMAALNIVFTHQFHNTHIKPLLH